MRRSTKKTRCVILVGARLRQRNVFWDCGSHLLHYLLHLLQIRNKNASSTLSMYETRVLGKHCPAKVSPKADRFSIQTGVQIEIDPATITDDATVTGSLRHVLTLGQTGCVYVGVHV